MNKLLSVISGCRESAGAWVQLWWGGERQGQDLRAQGGKQASASLFAINRK